MKAIEIWHKGEMITTAGLENGVVTATIVIRNQIDPMWLNVRGQDRDTGGHPINLHLPVHVGDEFVMRVVESA